MKTIRLFLLPIITSIGIFSCKKQEIKTTPLASIQITNVVAGGTTLQFGTNVTKVLNNGYTSYAILTGNQVLKLNSTDAPNSIYYNQTKDLISGGIYSLFLTGTPAAVESVFVKEDNIVPHTDNVFGIRVINLSPGSAVISVNLAGTANGSLFESVNYKALSEFKTVSAKAEEGTKTFEFRNVATGDLITTFDVPDYDLPRFRNINLVFAGMVGSETVIRVNNY